MRGSSMLGRIALGLIFALSLPGEVASVTGNFTAQVQIVQGDPGVPIVAAGEAEGKELKFGTVMTGGTCAGTVTVTPFNSPSLIIAKDPPSCVGSPPTSTGLFDPARFVITGAPNFSYNIGLPTSELFCGNPTVTPCLIVDLFTSTSLNNGGVNTGVLDSAGTDKVFVGATIHTPAGHPDPGSEFEQNINITVNYS